MSRPAAYIDFTYFDSEESGYKTGVNISRTTSAETRRAFRELRRVRIPIQEADFLCDLHDTWDFVVDSVGITREAFAAFTGQPVLSDAEYRRIDCQYWRKLCGTALPASPSHSE